MEERHVVFFFLILFPASLFAFYGQRQDQPEDGYLPNLKAQQGQFPPPYPLAQGSGHGKSFSLN